MEKLNRRVINAKFRADFKKPLKKKAMRIKVEKYVFP
jgi:hypothetical protein